MKQKMKRLLACTLAVMMLMSMSVVMEAQAAVKDNLPTKCRLYLYENFNYDTVELSLANADQSIENVKSKSKDLVAKLSSRSTIISDGVTEENLYNISFGTEKEGTYTVTYDIVENGETIETKKLTVYAYPSPVKSFTTDAENNYYYGNAKKSKIKVALLPGNTIKKLEVGTYQKKTDKNGTTSSEMVYKSFKNGATVTLGTSNYYYKSQQGKRGSKDSYYSGSLSSSLLSRTIIRITYQDKYTKQTEELYRNFIGLAK